MQSTTRFYPDPYYNYEILKSLVEPTRVHRDVYISEEIFALEMKRIWGQAWIYVGHESQVKSPGDYITTVIGQTPVVMVRDIKNNDINVLLNRCGHRGAQVCQARNGSATNGIFRCPYHGWRFRTDGLLYSQPNPAGYKDVGFDKNNHAFGMLSLPKVERYRGFVFACLAEEGPTLRTFLGEICDTIDNMVDRAPEGQVEVVGKTCHRFRHPVNWKFFTENLHDAMHPMVAHAGTTDAVRQYLKQLPQDYGSIPEIEVIAPFGTSYDFFDDMGFVGLPYGHAYMGGKKNIFSHYKIYQNYLKKMENTLGGKKGIFGHHELYPGYIEKLGRIHGRNRTGEILSFNRHNSLIYPSCTIRSNIPSVRVVIPVSVNETIIESWTFRLKGAPAKILERTLRYSRLINSPASMIGPDDLDCYIRIQESAAAGVIDWIDMHRHFGKEEYDGEKSTAIGTSDLALRNQYTAWLEYMAKAQ